MPIANAGTDQQVTLSGTSASTVLDGSASGDAEGSVLSFTWRQVSGPSTSTLVTPQFARTVATGLAAGLYRFELSVADRSGVSARDTVVVTVRGAANTAPIANAGPDLHLLLSTPSGTVLLDGSASSDPDGSLVAYRWSLVSGAPGTVVTTPDQLQTLVTGLQPGVYEFQLGVTDNRGAVARDTVAVTVQQAPNRASVADAGADRQITLAGGNSASAQLDGSGSHDPDGALVAYGWRLIAGPSSVDIASPHSAQTPVSGLLVGVYSFELTVTDNRGAIASDRVLITVLRADGPAAGPIARAGRDLVLLHPLTSAILDGSSSSSPAGALVGYFWQQVGGPAEGQATGHDAPRLKLSQLARGNYRFRLTVTDAQGRSASDELSVTVKRAAPVR